MEKGLQEKIKSHSVVQENGCWVWSKGKNHKGYGETTWKGIGRISAHRASHLAFKGQITKGLEIDHLCNTRACVNPEHLELVSHRENIQRKWLRLGIDRQKSPTIHLICKNCSVDFTKPECLIQDKIRNGRSSNFFCSRPCFLIYFSANKKKDVLEAATHTRTEQ